MDLLFLTSSTIGLKNEYVQSTKRSWRVTATQMFLIKKRIKSSVSLSLDKELPLFSDDNSSTLEPEVGWAKITSVSRVIRGPGMGESWRTSLASTKSSVPFADFHGINTSIMTNFKQPTWSYWNWNWRKMSIVGLVWASFSIPMGEWPLWGHKVTKMSNPRMSWCSSIPDHC